MFTSSCFVDALAETRLFCFTQGPYGSEHSFSINPFPKILARLSLLGHQAPDTKSPAPVHGWVSKAGPVSLIEWYGDLKPARVEIFRLWFEKYKETKKERKGEPWMYEIPHIMFPRCHIFVVSVGVTWYLL